MTSENAKEQKPVESMTFEECYSELQGLVEQFERGQMPLMTSVDRFERGMKLLQRCNDALADAEKRVENLLQRIEPEDPGEDAAPLSENPEPRSDEDIPF